MTCPPKISDADLSRLIMAAREDALKLGTLNATLNRDLHIQLPLMPMWKRIIPALELLFRGRVTIPGPRL